MIPTVPVKRKVTIIGDHWGYYEIETYTSDYEEVLIAKGKKVADHYFRPGIFTDKELRSMDHTHFLAAYLEGLAQSDKCPPQFFNSEFELSYQVEVVIDNLIIPVNLKDPERVEMVIELLQKTHALSQTFLESLSEQTIQNQKVSKIFEHYWITNLKLENITEMLEVSQM
jgi:hypothetical protein